MNKFNLNNLVYIETEEEHLWLKAAYLTYKDVANIPFKVKGVVSKHGDVFYTLEKGSIVITHVPQKYLKLSEEVVSTNTVFTGKEPKPAEIIEGTLFGTNGKKKAFASIGARCIFNAGKKDEVFTIVEIGTNNIALKGLNNNVFNIARDRKLEIIQDVEKQNKENVEDSKETKTDENKVDEQANKEELKDDTNTIANDVVEDKKDETKPKTITPNKQVNKK